MIQTRNDVIQTRIDVILIMIDVIRTRNDVIQTRNDVIQTRIDVILIMIDVIQTRNDLIKILSKLGALSHGYQNYQTSKAVNTSFPPLPSPAASSSTSFFFSNFDSLSSSFPLIFQAINS